MEHHLKQKSSIFQEFEAYDTPFFKLDYDHEKMRTSKIEFNQKLMDCKSYADKQI